MKPSQILLLFLFLLMLLTGCSKYHLEVVRQTLSRETLASTFVKSPDPRQKNPPQGEELLISWRLPADKVEESLHLTLEIIFCDLSQKTFSYPIVKRSGRIGYALLDRDYEKTGGFLTYKVEIINHDNQVIQQWKHLFWVDLITIDKE